MKAAIKIIVLYTVLISLGYNIPRHIDTICDTCKSIGAKVERKRLARALEKKGYCVDKDGRIFVKAEVILA